MNIEKLCEEFHEKVGEDKTVRISVEEGDTEDMAGWIFGSKEKKERSKKNEFFAESVGNGIRYSYIHFKAS